MNGPALGGEVDAIEGWVSYGDLVLDIGAHVGDFTAWALERGARVVAVEPYKPNVAEWRERFNGNPKAHIIHAALAAHDGEVAFSVSRDANNPSLGGFVIPGEGTRAVSLKTLLDSIGEPVALLKCDIEGGEYEAFAGAEFSAIPRLLIETHAWTTPTEPPIEGVGVHDGPSMRVDAYGTLCALLELTHALTIHGDSRGGYILGERFKRR